MFYIHSIYISNTYCIHTIYMLNTYYKHIYYIHIYTYIILDPKTHLNDFCCKRTSMATSVRTVRISAGSVTVSAKQRNPTLRRSNR